MESTRAVTSGSAAVPSSRWMSGSTADVASATSTAPATTAIQPRRGQRRSSASAMATPSAPRTTNAKDSPSHLIHQAPHGSTRSP